MHYFGLLPPSKRTVPLCFSIDYHHSRAYLSPRALPGSGTVDNDQWISYTITMESVAQYENEGRASTDLVNSLLLSVGALSVLGSLP